MKSASKSISLSAVLVLIGLVASAANVTPTEFANARLRGRTDKNVYKTGETITYTLWLQDMADEVTSGDYSVKYKLFDDDGDSETGTRTITSTNDTFTFTTSLTNPGFSRLDAWVVDSSDNNVVASALYSGMQVVFNGGAGADIDKLGPTVAEPSDFDTYWAGEIARLNEVAITETFCTDLGTVNNGAVRVYAVGVSCAARHTQPASARTNDTTQVTGYLCVPVDTEKKVPIQIQFDGYGVHNNDAPTWCGSDKIYFMVNAHGYELNQGAEYRNTHYENLKTQDSQNRWHEYAMNPEENADPNTAYFNGMVMRVLRAAQYVKQQAEAGGKCTMWDGTNLVSHGGSQGALQATWLAALDHDVTKLNTWINWNCNIGVTQDANAVQPTWKNEWAAGLGYYDEVHFAKRIAQNCEVTITRAGLGDELCPPKGLAAFYNALDTKKSIRWVQGSTHGYEPPFEGRQEFTYSSTFDTTWTGGDGEWFGMDNWSAGHPSAFSVVRLSPSAGGTISLGDTMRESANIGDFVNNSTPLVFSAEDGGGLTVTGNWSVCVGRVGHGSLGFNGGDYVLGGNLYAGWYYSGWNTSLPPSTGRVDVVNASVAAAYLELGTDHGYGILNVKNGSFNSTGNISIGAGSGTVGVVTLDDATLTNRYEVYVGNSGTGSIEVPTGSTFAPGTWVWIGQGSTGDGTVKLQGGACAPGSGVVIGNNGKGTLEIESGDYSTLKNIYMGWSATGEGTLRIKEGASLSGSYVEVGRTSGSKARVEVAGGEWVYNGGNLQIGVGADTEGEVVVSDGGSLSNCNDIYVGQNGTGTLTIESGGTVACNYWLDICRSANSQSTVNLNGGVLNVGRVNSYNGEVGGPTFNWNGGVFKPNGNYEYIFIDNGATDKIAVNVLAGGAILDTNGKNRSIASSLSGEGNFVKRGDEACYVKRAASLGRGIVVEAGSLYFEAGVTSGATATTPMKEISVAEDATLDLHNSEVYVQSYKVAGVAQPAGTYTEHNGTIHVSAPGNPVTATWTDAAGDGDFANSANWTCYDANGVVIWDALPTAADTVVTIPYYGDFFDTTGILAKEIVWAFPASTDANINLRSSGYSFGETIALDGGTTKFYNALNGVMMAADAWYDPSDETAIATNENGEVTSLVNKAYRGMEMDAAAIDSENMPTADGGFVVFDGDYGFKSVGTIESSETLPYTLFTVSNRNGEYGDGNSLYALEISSGDGMYEGALHILQWQINQWDYRLRAYVYKAEGTKDWTDNPTDMGSGNYVNKNHVFDVSLDGNALTASKIVHNGSGFDTGVKSLDFYGRTVASGGKLHVAYGSNLSSHRNVKSYGKVGESLVFSSAITEAERANIRNYLACKWCDEPWTTEPELGTNTLSSLTLSNGAVADFDGAVAVLDNLAGAGTVSNATSVAVTDTVTITVNSDGTIDPLVIDGSLTLGANAKLVVNGARYLTTAQVTALTATGGVTGTFAAVEADNDKPARVRYENGVVTVAKSGGFCIVIQ